MRKWVLSGILASEETYLSHLEALLLVRGAEGCRAGRAGLGSAAMEAWEQPPPAPWNPRQHPQEGRTRPWPRRSALPGGGGGGRTRETRCPAEPASRFCGC